MDKNEFIRNLADQFDDTELEEFSMEAKFQDLEEWSSLVGLSILNMLAKKYAVRLTYTELIAQSTVGELFDLVTAKAE